MKQKAGGSINVQLLQTLNILFENIRHETSLYFLLSNNHVNSIITHPFDFDNEEILAYYVYFLKTLSFKLNAHTVHFFFNETTDDFPLFTEAIKFFGSSEPMVRIAVRTITLNVFRVNDETVQKFVINRSQDYFNRVAKELAQHIIDMDVFARSAQNESSNRDRLSDMMETFIDYVHYVNDILMLAKEELNVTLMNAVFNFVLGSLCLSSLCGLRSSYTVLLSKVSALFVLTHFLLIIHDTSAIQSILTPLFFGDENDIRSQWVRSGPKGLHLQPRGAVEDPQERLFFNCHLRALSEGPDDHCAFHALMLIYAICQNRGVISGILEAAQVPCPGKSQKCDTHLLEQLMHILQSCIVQDTSTRATTVELCSIVLRRLLLAMDVDESSHCTTTETISRIHKELVNRLKQPVTAEDMFLEMFEEEYYHLTRNEIKMEHVSTEPGLYLPPSNTPISGLPLTHRLPCGNEERTRRLLQFFFVIRRLLHDLRGEQETYLPLSSKVQVVAELSDCINLNNSDLLACTVVTSKGEKFSRFLVTDKFQLILVEPDSRKLGWAVVRFVGLLQDTHAAGDTSDSRALHVVVEDVRCRATKNATPLLSAKLVFDDHIRCMAAKQRLSKGRKISRDFKMNLIRELFGVSAEAQRPASQARYVSGPRATAPGSVHKVASRTSQNDVESSPSSIPDDPDTTPRAFHNMQGGVVEKVVEYSPAEEPTPVEIKQLFNPKYLRNSSGSSSSSTGTRKSGSQESDKMQQALGSHRSRTKRLRKMGSGTKLPNSVEKRNARERTRVHTVNQAFHILRYRLPALRANTKRVSKLKILKAALQYIYALTDLLEAHPIVHASKIDMPAPTTNVHHIDPSMALRAPPELNHALAFSYPLADVGHHIYNPAVAQQIYRDVIYHPSVNAAHHDVFSTLRQLQ
ncbi:hypothetical protein AAVH_00392 [Aphelenchoides avenae]|nr:hypothetical protein AAVH_00392 [Aphelenchus avenae]